MVGQTSANILAAMLSGRDNYDTVREALCGDYKTALTPLEAIIAEGVEDFYTRDPSAGACSKEALIQRLQATHDGSKHLKVITDFVARLDGNVSVPNLVFDIRQARRRRVGDKISGLLANREFSPEVDELIKQYQELGDEPQPTDSEDVYSEVGVEDLLRTHFTDEGTIPFASQKLVELTDGGARAGHHVLIFARPEIGKTLFVLDEVAYWCGLGLRVLYCGNEDPLSDITLRLIGRLSGRTKDQIRNSPRETETLVAERGYGNFVGASLAPGNYGQINKLVDKYEPRIVVLDQLRNIDVGDDNRVTALEKAAIGARNLAKSRGVLVLSVTQAGDSAEGKPFLELSDIDFSKTGIPGAIDLAIGIGATEEDKRFGVRQISLPKNKLGGQHGHFSVKFDTKTGIVEEIRR